MHYKKLIFSGIFLFTVNVLMAQNRVSGKILNGEGKALELAEVLLQNKDSLMVRSELTHADGKFAIEIEKGDYLLMVRQLGVILHKQKITADKNLDLDVIQINDSKNHLQEVVVTAKKKLIERKVDRLVFNVENSISANIGDAVDALKVTPGLRVQNDGVSMIGKSGMTILIDDRIIQLSGDDLINFLKSIKSIDIKSIEVITNPPAKYDAEGNSGLVNIKLKKAKNDSWSGNVSASFKQATYATGGLGTAFNYQKNKLSLSSNANYSNGNTAGIETSKINYPNQVWNSINKGKYKTDMLSARLGVDYQLKKNWSVGVQFIGSTNKPKTDDRNATDLQDLNQVNQGSIFTKGSNNKKKDLKSLNLHSVVNLDTLGRKINVDFDYLNFKSSDNRGFYSDTFNSTQPSVPNGFYSANNNSATNISNYAAKIDVEHPFKWANLNYGAKISFSNTENSVFYYDTTSGVPVLDPLQSNEFAYEENTQALYFSANKKIGKKWSSQLGLRMENTQTTGESISLSQVNTTSYTRFFPTFYLNFVPKETHSLSFSYNKRIRRPGFMELNPFRWYSNSYSYSVGNPNLQPNYTHNLTFDFNYRDYLMTTFSFSSGINNSAQVTILNTQTFEQVVQRMNYFNDQTFNLSQVYIYNKIKWFESENSINVYYSKSESKIYPITPRSNEGYGSSFNTTNTFVLNDKGTFLTGFNFQYNFPSQSGSFQKNDATNALDLFFKAGFLNNKLQITIAAENLLKSKNFSNTSVRNDIKIKYTGYYDSRYVGFSAVYKLGNKNINSRRKQVSNQEEKDRTN